MCNFTDLIQSMREDWASDVAILHRHFVSEFNLTVTRFNVAYTLHENNIDCGTVKKSHCNTMFAYFKTQPAFF